MQRPKVNIIDVGAKGGLEPPWTKHKTNVGTVLGFEPDGSERIGTSKIVLPYAIWSRTGEQVLYLYGKGVGSASLMRQNFDWVRSRFNEIKARGSRRLNESWFKRSTCVGKMRVQVRTLDSVLAELREGGHAEVPFHFLKSDTQSGEYEVLLGAKQYLESECVAALLEVFRYPLLEGIRLAEDIKAHMDSLGFDVIGWSDWQASFLSQRDLLFARRDPRSDAEGAIIDLVKSIYGVDTGPAAFSHKRSLIERVIRRARIKLRMD
jgi:FkbM family methyltransferase